VHLKELFLNRNGIHVIPLVFAELPSLERLSLSHNSISDMDEIDKVRRARVMPGPSAVHAPPVIRRHRGDDAPQFTNLKSLWLDWNKIERVPMTLGTLSRLGVCP
jgi:Leucine-rich repeat (LRR) protein